MTLKEERFAAQERVKAKRATRLRKVDLSPDERMVILTALETERMALENSGEPTTDVQRLIERFRGLTGEKAAWRT